MQISIAEEVRLFQLEDKSGKCTESENIELQGLLDKYYDYNPKDIQSMRLGG